MPSARLAHDLVAGKREVVTTPASQQTKAARPSPRRPHAKQGRWRRRPPGRPPPAYRPGVGPHLPRTPAGARGDAAGLAAPGAPRQHRLRPCPTPPGRPLDRGGGLLPGTPPPAANAGHTPVRHARLGPRSGHARGGQRVWLLDGSSCSLPDTPERQQAFSPPDAPKPGCGFPVAHLVSRRRGEPWVRQRRPQPEPLRHKPHAVLRQALVTD